MQFNLMLKIILPILLSLFTTQALSNTSNTNDKSLSEQCKKLFTEMENLITDAEKQPGTHIQLNKLKNQLNQNKKQILALDAAMQIKSCEIALSKINAKQN